MCAYKVSVIVVVHVAEREEQQREEQHPHAVADVRERGADLADLTVPLAGAAGGAGRAARQNHQHEHGEDERHRRGTFHRAHHQRVSEDQRADLRAAQLKTQAICRQRCP